MKNFIKNPANWLLIAVILCLIWMIFLGGCASSYEVIWKESLPDTCNMALNQAELHYKSDDKSGTVNGFDKCYKCLAFDKCRKEVFGVDDEGKPNPIDWDDKEKVDYFNQCRDKLQ